MKQEVGTRQNSPSYLALGYLRNAVKGISSSSGLWAVSFSLHQCLRVSLLFLIWFHPAQAITEDPAGPCVHASERRRAEEQLNFSWLLLRAASPSQLRGLSKGYFPLLSLLKWRLRWFQAEEPLSQRYFRDTRCSCLGTSQAEGNEGQNRLRELTRPVKRTGSGRASTRLGRSWHSERPRRERGFNLPRTPAKSMVPYDTQLLFPKHQLEWPSPNRKLHLVWGHTSAPYVCVNSFSFPKGKKKIPELEI